MQDEARSVRPNTFIIGAPKCGTTALAAYLSEHPDAFLCYPKEPSFWSFDLRTPDGGPHEDRLDNYLKFYAHGAGKTCVLDASTRYIYSEAAVPRILAFAPDAKFVVILRDPVEVARAYHMEKVFNTFEDITDFREAWELQEARERGEHIPPGCPEPKELQYRKVAALGSQLKRVVETVPEGQLLVLFHQDLATDPRALWLRLQGFLGLKDDGRTEFPVVGGAHFNRFAKLAKFYQNPPKTLVPLVFVVKRALRTGNLGKRAGNVVISALTSRRGRDPIEESFAAELRSAFAGEVALIKALTGREIEP